MSEEKYKFTIPPKSAVQVNATGNRVYCEAATAVFFMNVEGVQDYEMKAKRTRKLSQPLTKFFLENRTDAPNTVELHIGFEEVHDNEVHISGTIDGDVKIINSPGQVLKVEDVSQRGAVFDVKANTQQMSANMFNLIALLKNANEQRIGLTTLQGASYSAVSNASTVLVTAAANTKGVILRRAFWTSSTMANAYGAIRAGGNLIASLYCYAGLVQDSPENIFIPAGQALIVESSATAMTVHTYYEVLT